MAAGSAHVPRRGTTDVLHGRKASGPLLRLASDERLVARVRAGSEAAFAVLWDRYQGQLLSFCRHMLGSHHEAEDAVQIVFVNAYRDILRSDRELRVRPWLYRIARNQCLSMFRIRRPVEELGDEEPSPAGLSEQVAGRAELRDLLRDMARLPADQREALLLAELHDNSHADVAEIIGCDREKVKALVFQARTSLIKSRRARDVSCEEIQRQLSVLRGGSLRRGVLRRHLAECEACRLFHAEVKHQRASLAIVLPVTPVGVLKLGAAGALAATGGAAGSGATVGSAATIAAKLGVPAAFVKGAVATVAVTTVAAGGVASVEVARHATRDQRPATIQTAPRQPGLSAPAGSDAAVNAQRPGSDRVDRPGGTRDRTHVKKTRHPGTPDTRPLQRRREHKAVPRREKAAREQARLEGRRPARREGQTTRPKRPVRKHPPTVTRPSKGERPQPAAGDGTLEGDGTTRFPPPDGE